MSSRRHNGVGALPDFRRYYRERSRLAVSPDFMSEDHLLAAEYRKHAKALRAAARFDREAKTSLILKRIAEDYEQMAKALEGARPSATSPYDRPDGQSEPAAKPK